ncbi:MAG: ABC transporter permease/substrate-binding protein [Leptolyngbyaceae cyanobacterium]
MGFLSAIPYGSEILVRMGEHLILVAISTTVAIALGLPLGILITRQPKLTQPILGFANAVQTIPSLAIFGFLISVPLLGGIGKTPAIVALTLYALLPIIRNTYTGIIGIDPAIREAGRGMGMTDRQLLLQVEIPLALSVILAGVRVATVISVGIATIAAAVGGGGLGVFIFRGIASVDNQLILAGAIPSALIAFGADFLLGLLEKYLNQRDRHDGSASKLLKRLLLLSLAGIIAVGVGAIAPLWSSNPGTITIGAKSYTEQIVLGEILAQTIETNTNLKVNRRFNLGGTLICHEALKAGQIDGYVEYTGTAFTAILQRTPVSDRQAVYDDVKQTYGEQFDIEVFESLGFDNSFAIVIRREEAERLNITTLSEAVQYAMEWQPGFGYEFLEREDGYQGLVNAYGFTFKAAPKPMEVGLTFQALKEGKIDLLASGTTEGLIAALDLVILEDDKNFFPPYEAVPLFNRKTLDKYPNVEPAIEQLADIMSLNDMQQLNYQVDQQGIPVALVVEEFLASRLD